MKKMLIVVDMQNDFVNGALGSNEAVAIIPAVEDKVRHAIENEVLVVFTRDTHYLDYMDTMEGRNLPVSHCIEGTRGWEIIPQLRNYTGSPWYCNAIDKIAFGSIALAYIIGREKPDEIELVGLCTDICVISNALIAKAACPEAVVSVDASCCAGVTPERHRTALEAMKACQIVVKE